MAARQYDERYAEFRAKVRKRDKGKCQYPGCKKRGHHVHHISRWADNSEMRYEVSNGIYLCRICHKRITGHEIIYADMFREIVKKNSGK